MARIKILELPSIQVGEYYETPFVIVIDQVDSTELRTHTDILVRTETEPIDGEAIKAATGARGVIIHPGTLDIA